jgi:hypothetical protein
MSCGYIPAARSAIALFLAAQVVVAAVPPPSETPVVVVVSGRTSRIQSIVITNAGRELPETFSGKYLTNTPGFEWWVSRHFALKTDYPWKWVDFYLRLLEMSYPHYVRLFGREPAGIETNRMTVVYASSFEKLERAMKDDDQKFPRGAGGVTMDDVKIAYQMELYNPAHEWDHPRYIVLHECTHLFQICLNGTCDTSPVWFFEGVADRLAQHVYDSEKKTLTVDVFDKAGPCYKTQEGMHAFENDPELTIEEVIKRNSLSVTRGACVLVCAFLDSTPDRADKFRRWRDAMFAKEGRQADLIEKYFGPWEQLNAEFKSWRSAHKLSFSSPEWRQWSQDGDTLWAFRSPPGDTSRWSCLNVLLPPGEPPDAVPWRMDWPARERNWLVRPVRRGVPEPSVGCLVDMSNGPDAGRAGFALGVAWEKPPEKSNGLPASVGILLDGDGSLLIRGTDLGLQDRKIPLPRRFRSAMAAGGHKAGITATIAQDVLRIVLRARHPLAAKAQKFVVAVPLTPEQRNRLMTGPMALLAQDGYHGVTPCFDPGRAVKPDAEFIP